MNARLRGIVVVLAGVLGGSPRAESVDPEVRARVEGLLGAYRAVTFAEWRALGSDAAPVLQAVARDRAALPTRRARALAALGAIQSVAAGPVVRELAADATAPRVLRSAAVDAAPSVLGDEATTVLVPLLRDRDSTLRLRSARALAASGAAGCRAVVAEARTRPVSDPVSQAAASCRARLQATPQPAH
jgi:HEAT repeat protein